MPTTTHPRALGMQPNPDLHPLLGELIESYKHMTLAHDRAPTDTAYPFRGSDAGHCSKQLAYQLARIPVTNEQDTTSWYNAWIGRVIHDGWATLLGESADRIHEVEFRIERHGLLLVSGHGDTLDGTEAIEMKTEGRVGFEEATGFKFDEPTPPGPKWRHVAQLALEVVGIGAERGTLIILSRENIGRARAATRYGQVDHRAFTASWTWTHDELQPVAEAELERLARIAGLPVGAVERHSPAYGPDTLLHPIAKTWVRLDDDGKIAETGRAWECSYCPYLDHCVEEFRARR